VSVAAAAAATATSPRGDRRGTSSADPLPAKLTHEETQRALRRERKELESKLEHARVRAEILAVSEIDLLDAINAARADAILLELETSML
jgi:hypothetical protein